MRLNALRRRLRQAREPLPSLYDRYPDALAAPRHPRGIRAVPLSAIVGTARHPSQNTMDFQPLPQLRGRNWESRWQRILGATRRLEILPPVELLQVGDEYWVVDGHNRIAAGLESGAAAIDADVTELILPGKAAERHIGTASSALLGSEALRQAGEGRLSRTAEFRPGELSRDEILQSLSGDVSFDDEHEHALRDDAVVGDDGHPPDDGHHPDDEPPGHEPVEEERAGEERVE